MTALNGPLQKSSFLERPNFICFSRAKRSLFSLDRNRSLRRTDKDYTDKFWTWPSRPLTGHVSNMFIQLLCLLNTAVTTSKWQQSYAVEDTSIQWIVSKKKKKTCRVEWYSLSSLGGGRHSLCQSSAEPSKGVLTLLCAHGISHLWHGVAELMRVVTVLETWVTHDRSEKRPHLVGVDAREGPSVSFSPQALAQNRGSFDWPSHPTHSCSSCTTRSTSRRGTSFSQAHRRHRVWPSTVDRSGMKIDGSGDDDCQNSSANSRTSVVVACSTITPNQVTGKRTIPSVCSDVTWLDLIATDCLHCSTKVHHETAKFKP